MKLLICLKCSDVFKVGYQKVKSCDCGETQGQYIDNLYAEYKGHCCPLGFANSSLIEAIRNQPETNWGKEFTAFVIQKECDTFVRVEEFTKFKKERKNAKKIK